MTIHLCRDFLTLTSTPTRVANMYFMSAFLVGVLGYSVYSNVNFNLTSSQYTLASSTGSLAALTALSTSSVITVDPTHKIVSAADLNRFVSLRSTTYPKHNSGLFRIVSASISDNKWILDYRSSESPPSDSVSWILFEKETSIPTISTGSNGLVGVYATFGSGSSSSRIMLQSPTISGSNYYVRLSQESGADVSGTIPSGFSISLGVSPTQYADFAFKTQMLHGPMFFNSTSSLYRGTAVGLVPSSQGVGQFSFFAIGDDVTGTSTFFNKNQTYTTGGNGWCSFGFASDESSFAYDGTLSLMERLYALGYSSAPSQLTFRSGYAIQNMLTGICWSRFGTISSCVPSLYCDTINGYTHVRSNTNAAPTKFGTLSILTNVELICGTFDSFSTDISASFGVLGIAPRRLGVLSNVMVGVSNASSWTLYPSYDNSESWMHTLDGIFFKWGGPLLSGSLSSSSLPAVWQITSSYSTNTGLNFYDPASSGIDYFVMSQSVPSTTSSLEEIRSFDANRYKKTYSYYRQPSVNIGIRRA